MKRAWLVLAALLIVAATPFRLKSVLENATANERTAAARYEAFATKAAEEGNLGAASLVRAATHAEHVHADRLAAALRERGLDVPEARVHPPFVGNTTDNLRAAANAETAERDGIYREAVQVALESSDEALSKIFDQARDTEVEHANLISAMLRDSGLMKTAKTYYVCDTCGYTTDIALPMRALCRARGTPRKIE